MWYDLFILGVLVFFTLRGAMRGVVWQIAGIAGIILCFMFADGISNAVGPYIRLEPPLNHWVALAGAYLGLSFVCFGLARAFNEWMEKNKLKEFDRHLGAVFGLVKGVILAVILTFFVVTISERAHDKLKDSYSAKYSAIIMDRLHPVLPARLHDALAKYIHSLDNKQLPLINGHDANDPFHTHGPNDSHLGQSQNSPQQNGGGSLWDQLSRAFSQEAQNVVAAKLQQVSDPNTRARMQQDLDRIIQSVPAADRERVQQEIVNAGANQLQQYIDWKLSQLTPSNPPPPLVNTNANLNPQPNAQVNGPVTGAQIGQLVNEVAQLAAGNSGQQQSHTNFINQNLAGVPMAVCHAVLLDMRADFSGGMQDPDPSTNANSTIDQRIMRQLQSFHISIDQLAPIIQQRLGGQAQQPRAGSLQ